MKKLLVTGFILYTQWAVAQAVKIDNSILFSSFKNSNKEFEILSDAISTHAFSAGLDHTDRKWFYISSQLGVMTLGGQEENPSLPDSLRHIKERKSFVHLNSTFRAYIGDKISKAFVGIGPYFNVLIGSSQFRSKLYKDEPFRIRSHVGVKAELGISHDIGKIRIGLAVCYLYSLSPSVSTEFLSLRSRNMGINFTLGYKI